jgi:hypothetical protein
MEPKLLLGLATSILGSLIGKMFIPAQAPPTNIIEPTKPPIVVEHRVSHSELKPPFFITHVPQEHFAGISEPSKSLTKARKSAIDDVVRQILGSISTQYDHKFIDRVSGNIKNMQRVIDDKLSGTAHGIVLDVEKNIVKSFWSKDGSGKFVYFVLVYYPEQKIQEMRRLSKCAEVIASVLFIRNGNVQLKISEINGVEATISSVNIKVLKKNRFAKAITMFLWHVPQITEQRYSVYFDPIIVCGNSKHTEIPLKNYPRKFTDYLLGAKIERIAVLKGYDELDRPISLWIPLL